MFTPINTNASTERPRIRTEREYREWQQSLHGLKPVRRFRNEAGFLTRLTRLLRRLRSAERAPHNTTVTELHPVEHKA